MEFRQQLYVLTRVYRQDYPVSQWFGVRPEPILNFVDILDFLEMKTPAVVEKPEGYFPLKYMARPKVCHRPRSEEEVKPNHKLLEDSKTVVEKPDFYLLFLVDDLKLSSKEVATRYESCRDRYLENLQRYRYYLQCLEHAYDIEQWKRYQQQAQEYQEYIGLSQRFEHYMTQVIDYPEHFLAYRDYQFLLTTHQEKEAGRQQLDVIRQQYQRVMKQDSLLRDQHQAYQQFSPVLKELRQLTVYRQRGLRIKNRYYQIVDIECGYHDVPRQSKSYGRITEWHLLKPEAIVKLQETADRMTIEIQYDQTIKPAVIILKEVRSDNQKDG